MLLGMKCRWASAVYVVREGTGVIEYYEKKISKRIRRMNGVDTSSSPDKTNESQSVTDSKHQRADRVKERSGEAWSGTRSEGRPGGFGFGSIEVLWQSVVAARDREI
jgi:hypothetical protein